MFYQFDDELVSVDVDDLKDNSLTAGYISVSELSNIHKRFGIPYQALEMCRVAADDIYSSVDIYDNCYFIRLSVLDENMHSGSSMGIFVLENMLLLVSISDKGVLNRDLFMKAISRINNDNAGVERLLISFLENLVLIDDKRLEDIRKSIAAFEEMVIKNSADEQFNISLLEIKGKILSCRGYYEGLIDISQVLAENDNEIFDDTINRLARFTDKVKRLKDSVDALTESVVHLWDAYQASLEMHLNETMKFFTLVTTIFFPLTVIVGWYGMNFSSMPEFDWKYGYIYVILLSILIITILILWFKKKRWI